ncbi:amidohydrolase family protein [Flagellimonas sp. 2504JD1-5]
MKKNIFISIMLVLFLGVNGCSKSSNTGEVDIPKNGNTDQSDVDDTIENPNPTTDTLDDFLLNPVTDKIVITDVNVLDVENGIILPSTYDVFLQDQKIYKISSSPSDRTGFKEITGTDKFLMPGLSDMHTHLVTSSNLKYDLFLFLAKGVTNVRIMWGFKSHVDMRNSINTNKTLGPNLYVASAGFDGSNSTWPGAINTSTNEDIETFVDAFKAEGFDYIKVYNGLPNSQYLKLLEYSQLKKIKVVGHVPSTVDYFDAVSNGQYSIEHMSRFSSSSHSQEEIFSAVQNNSTFNCPTLSVLYRSTSNLDLFKNHPWISYLSPQAINFFDQTEASIPSNNNYYQSTLQVTEDFQSRGLKILSGTDTGIRYVIPGVSLHEELIHLSKSGMSIPQVLKTTTLNVGEYLKDSSYGTIKEGNRADLILLQKNPLLSLKNLELIDYVFIKGKDISASEITRVLELIKNEY